VSKTLSEIREATPIAIGQILNDDGSDGPSSLQLPSFSRIGRKFRVIGNDAVLKFNRDLTVQAECTGTAVLNQFERTSYRATHRPKLRNEVGARLKIKTGAAMDRQLRVRTACRS